MGTTNSYKYGRMVKASYADCLVAAARQVNANWILKAKPVTDCPTEDGYMVSSIGPLTIHQHRALEYFVDGFIAGWTEAKK